MKASCGLLLTPVPRTVCSNNQSEAHSFPCCRRCSFVTKTERLLQFQLQRGSACSLSWGRILQVAEWNGDPVLSRLASWQFDASVHLHRSGWCQTTFPGGSLQLAPRASLRMLTAYILRQADVSSSNGMSVWKRELLFEPLKKHVSCGCVLCFAPSSSHWCSCKKNLFLLLI